MDTQCTSTPQAISGVLLAGDAVLNLTDQTLSVTSGTRFIAESSGRLVLTTASETVKWRPELQNSVLTLLSAGVTRIVVVTDEITDPSGAHSSTLLDALSVRGIRHLHCVLHAECDADSFMDEADAEAVTERLRQLGYI
jgi:hypothetical protein